ncbi:MAG: nitroreductase family protein [Geobacteraceae bacterium]|nr:nitroreductase family protein [Geobacteraceae bacterium]
MIELLRKRRSIRKFCAEPVSSEHLDTILEAALRAPSSRGINPWEFIVIDDPNLLKQLSTAKQHGAEFLKNAPLGIVVCAETTKSDVCIEDCSIAAIIIQLTALSLGLGSCWAQMRCRFRGEKESAESYIRELLGLPEHFLVEAVIGIGHPDEQKPPVKAETLQRKKISYNRWGAR